jgi:hypothetical protein
MRLDVPTLITYTALLHGMHGHPNRGANDHVLGLAPHTSRSQPEKVMPRMLMQTALVQHLAPAGML